MKIKVLYGDDNAENRIRFSQKLTSKNYLVDVVSSPQEFISRARSGNYRAVVSDLDYSPEGAEGHEVIKKIRAVPSLKILFTGRSGFENAVEGFESGADHVVLSKDLGELVEILDKELKGGEENDR